MHTISITPFKNKLNYPLTKKDITVLQINLGKRCNLACTHCHVEAGPKRTEELSPEVCQQLIEIIHRFPEIQIVDLTGGAPEMNYGFKPLVEAARANNKQVIVRSNLTIYFVDGFSDLPEYFAQHELKVVASMPCYLADNVDKMRGFGVFDHSIKALQWLNKLGYGKEQNLILDLVYNPQLPTSEKFSLAPEQANLERDYKIFLQKHFGIVFNNLFTITNLPVGRTQMYLERKKLYTSYLQFLESHFNNGTIDHLMCRDQLSIDYLGNVYDCDFNQMMNLPAKALNGETLTVKKLLEADSLDLISEIQAAAYCYGCTAGCGSSCGGALV
ncbi:arsenosugar biosynthesis radical SAM protein ArsS [Nostocaceae cyanobacterium CENA357]|uniref:Arsenosugar biosynthesis radical SAM protein ArsS n=1 Tax=Atlanticothrix silvestris CENA357 TaxID=1725252 RepID=A0A8J7HGR7_9CYAN|nr:arsenosugar biosynthesis radical SAM (seleno)protein ArsS [Atlanticothrix silvestris]MBH8552619.1 arsenosugar biosynthesis radical SAM protein ArsS [Atlanticothrix silvestris CENA357]